MWLMAKTKLKYDLRNRPHLAEFGHYTEFLEAVEEWFVEFEKELRGLQAYKKDPDNTYIKIKEVLGEET